MPAERHRARARLRHRQFHGPCPGRACGSSASSWIRISGRIARALHPDADIRIENFRDSQPAAGRRRDRQPAVCRRASSTIAGQKLPLHDFFIAKIVDALKPGGILAVVTSHFTLDKQNAAAREYLADQADFLGAIRLPSDAFKREGTSVVTDIVFLRKRAPGQAAQPRRPGMAGHRRRSASTAPTSRSTAIS